MSTADIALWLSGFLIGVVITLVVRRTRARLKEFQEFRTEQQTIAVRDDATHTIIDIPCENQVVRVFLIRDQAVQFVSAVVDSLQT